MPIKVLETVATDDRTTVKIDLFGDKNVKGDARDVAQSEAGDFIVEQVLLSLHKAQSPVIGESFPKLSSQYAAKKKEEGGEGKPNLELSGEMLDALEWRPTKTGIEVGFFGDQAPKADGHLKFSGLENNTPKRRFLPGEGQNFKHEIRSELDKIVNDAIVENTDIPDKKLEKVSSKSELYELLKERFGDLTRSEIRDSVLRSADIADLLDEFDLLQYL